MKAVAMIQNHGNLNNRIYSALGGSLFSAFVRGNCGKISTNNPLAFSVGRNGYNERMSSVSPSLLPALFILLSDKYSHFLNVDCLIRIVWTSAFLMHNTSSFKTPL